MNKSAQKKLKKIIKSQQSVMYKAMLEKIITLPLKQRFALALALLFKINK